MVQFARSGTQFKKNKDVYLHVNWDADKQASCFLSSPFTEIYMINIQERNQTWHLIEVPSSLHISIH